MKRLICTVLTIGVLLPLLTGCAGSKTAQNLPGIPPATETREAAQQKAKEAYEIPDRFTGEWTGLENTFHVTADGEILLPDMGRLCTAKVKRHAFTQEEADKFMAVFFQGNPLYEEITMTKERYQELQAHYEAIQRGEIPYEHDGSIDDVPKVLKEIEAYMETAPHEGERIPANTQYHTRDRGMPEGTTEIAGWTEVEGRKLHCLFWNDQGSHPWGDSVKIWEDGYGDSMGASITVDSVDNRLSLKCVPFEGNEQAMEVGDGLMDRLGLTQFVCDKVIPVEYAKLVEDGVNQVYQPVGTGEAGVLLEYVRQVNGLPLTKTNFNGGASEDGAPDIGVWQNEQIEIYVLGDRVVCFQWENPYEVTEIQSAGELMDFKDIQEIFGKMIFVKNSGWLGVNQANDSDDSHDLHVDKVQLPLMRVRPKDNVMEGAIIPVWDFWGTSQWYEETGEKIGEPDYGVLMTLNAVDGTLVDREIGY